MHKAIKVFLGFFGIVALFAVSVAFFSIIRSGLEIQPTRYWEAMDTAGLLKKNAASLRRLPRSRRFVVWFFRVKPGGSWDYKTYRLRSGQKIYVDDQALSLLQFGNFNYGYTGRVLGLPLWMLKLGAGVVNVVIGQRPGPWLDAPYGPRWIEAGWRYYR